jgi:hypothetical protein
MALSDDEQDRLNELETFTQAADPGFADSLGGAAADRWQLRQSAFAWSASLLGILAMLAGLGAARGLISIGTIVICYGFLLTAWGAGTAVQILKRKMARTSKTRERA